MTSRLDPVWQEALAPLAPHVFDEGERSKRRVRRADEQALMREAITRGFQALASVSPTLLVIEDAHWADEDTVAALDHMAGQIGEDRLLVVVSYRHGEARERSEVWDLLRTLDRLPSWRRPRS
jgi:hypothetical protein